MRRTVLTRLIQRLGIIFLILELANVPVPVPEFHPIRPVDRSGEVCSLHDHVARPHRDDAGPEDAGLAIRWHWAPLGFGPVDAWGHDDGHQDLLGSELPDDPDIAPGARSGLHFGLLRRSQGPADWGLGTGKSRLARLSDSASSVGNFASTFPGRSTGDAMLQHWRC